MSTLLPLDLTNTEIAEIERFTKNYEIRVKLFRDTIDTVYDTTPVAHSDYNASTGIYEIDEEIWLKRVVFSSTSGYNVVKIEYEDLNGNWIVAKTYKSSTSNHDLRYSVYGKKFRISEYKELDPTDIAYPATPTIYAEEWQDISDYIGDQITTENSSGNMLGEIKLPFVSLTLDNSNGRWHKNTSFYLKSNVETWVSPLGAILTSKTVLKKAGVKISVEIKFLGQNWEDKNWIMLAVFYARKWTSVQVSGESGWVAKTLYDTPIVEGINIDEVINNYICRDKGDMLLQIIKDEEKDILTVTNEVIGEADLEPTLPNKIIDGTQTHSFCRDDRHIYYSIKIAGTTANTFNGGYIEVRRMLLSGENDEYIGRIYAVPQRIVEHIGADFHFNNNFYSASFSEINNGLSLQRMIRGCYGMDVDGEYLYISVVSICNEVFLEPIPLYSAAWIAESLLYKLKKDGSGWSDKVGPNVTISETKFDKTPYTTSYVHSLGFEKDLATGVGTYVTYDFLDVAVGSGDWSKYIRNVMIIDDGGTEKLLFVKDCNRNDTYTGSSPNGSEFYICNKDLTSIAIKGYTDSTVRVEAIAQVSDIIMYIHWSVWDNGALQGKYLGVLDRDPYTGDFFIANYGSAPLTEWFLSMDFVLDGLYTTGNNFDGGVYFADYESVEADGIKEKYKCVFQLGAYNIVHFQHATRNLFNSFHVPEIRLNASPISYETVKYASEYLADEIMVTTGWVLNLKTGEVTLRQAYPSNDPINVTADYDFERSVMFYEGDSKSRLDTSALGKIAQASSRNYIINEAGMLERLKFIESQLIPVRHPIFDYDEVDEDNGEKTDGGDKGIRLTNGTATDRLTSFQFTPKFDGYVDSIRFPIKIIKQLTLDPIYNNDKDVEIYITDESSGQIDYRSTDGNKPVTPPTSADIALLIDNGKIFIGHNRIGVNDESEYKWVYFNVASAAYKVTANTRYGIIIRVENCGGSFNYYTLGKKVSDANNRVIEYSSLADGSDITLITASNWTMTDSTTDPGVMAGYVEVKKTRQELKSVNIVDSLNPNISSGFTSSESGDDTTILVRSDDLLTTYDRGATDDYIIEYSGGKFWIDFDISGSLIIDSILRVALVTWFESKTDLLEITDSDNIISESSEFGDHTTYLSTRVQGKKLSPADAPAQIHKIFDLYPGILLSIEAENQNQKKIEATNIYDWNESRKKFDLIIDETGESSKFVFEFKDPFVIGTTGFIVKYGLGKTTDKVLVGATSYLTTHNVPAFYQVLVTSKNFADNSYHVMLYPYDYREWRVATEEDYDDMIGNCIGAEPSSASDVKTTDQFYLKHMNQAFGIAIVHFTAYESEEKTYYIDENGVILEDNSYIGSGDKNPVHTSFPGKRIYVKLEPVDFSGVPMFEYHAEFGEPGYYSGAYSLLDPYHACKIDRADIYSKGMNVVYSNYGVYFKRFLNITIIGYPINKQTDIKDERRRTGYEHADAKHLTIDNNLIQSQSIVTRISMLLDDFWGKERISFRKDVVYDPRFRPGAIVKVTSELENLTNHLFYVTSPKNTLALSSGMRTSLGSFLQI